MKHFLSVCIIACLFCSSAFAQKLEVIKYDELEKLMKDTQGKDLVINFWATWCRPCIVEMPYFEKIGQDYKNKNVEVVLVTLDFVENKDRVIKFMERRNIQSKVLLLDEIDYNEWIDKVEPSWSGAIPATLLINSKKGKRAFYEQEFKEEELIKTVNKFIN